jgi:hypothetical protein
MAGKLLFINKAMKEKEQKIVPAQHTGQKVDEVEEIQCQSSEEADKLFSKAAQRLLDVNNWDRVCGPLSAKFSLMDASGSPVQRRPQQGDYFRINVPGPGPKAGEGFDWVQVEKIEERKNEDDALLAIRVRPAASPLNADRDIAHFFNENATSTFSVQRSGNAVVASVHGRNEEPNTDTSRTVDKVRNAVVGGGASAGLSKPQWKSLVSGLLDNSGEVA